MQDVLVQILCFSFLFSSICHLENQCQHTRLGTDAFIHIDIHADTNIRAHRRAQPGNRVHTRPCKPVVSFG